MGKKKNKNKLPKSYTQPKKQRKRMKPENKAKLILGLRTIYSNQACIDAGRNLSWWMPVILTLCAIMLALVPTLTSRLSADIGYTMLGSTTYNLDTSLVHFTDDMQEAGATLTIVDGKMVANNWDEMKSDEVPWYQYRDTASDKVTFEVFYNDSAATNDEDYISYVADGYNPYTHTARTDITTRRTSSEEEEDNDEDAVFAIEPKKEDEEATEEESSGDVVDEITYTISRIIFGQEYFRIYVYDTTGTAQTGFVGSYDRLEGASLPSYFLNDVEGSLAADADAYIDALVTNWREFFVRSYETMKVIGAWELTGIMGGVYLGLIFLMGLVVFLLCRGKNNPYRIITFWEAQKISYWISFTPGLLSLIGGFMFSSWALFLFIVFFGARIMWASFKSLRPSYAPAN